MPEDNLAIVRSCYEAYATGDRALLERLIGDPFRFTSPLDNGLDRATYFARCWPNHDRIAGFRFIRLHEMPGGEVVATYEGEATDGHLFRNTEVLTIRDGRIVAVEVYFGWSLPHPAPEGGFTEE